MQLFFPPGKTFGLPPMCLVPMPMATKLPTTTAFFRALADPFLTWRTTAATTRRHRLRWV